jgi:hypothetical protein
MQITQPDRTIIRDLARQVAEVAALPVMGRRRAMWILHNSLHRVRPMVLVFPEGSWRELLPGDQCLRCEGPDARGIEWNLRAKLYHHENLHDDSVIEAEWFVDAAIGSTGWGLEPRWHQSEDPTGARGFDPVLLDRGDLAKLRYPEYAYDKDATDRAAGEMEELFGDILTVKRRGVRHISFHLMSMLTCRRGLAETMMDMADNPQFVHDAMAIFAEGERRRLDFLVDNNLLSLNNDSTYHSSGGNGYTADLPAAGSDPAHVRLADMWGSAEAQELAQVSPEMHEEFSLRYERPLLAPFGLTGYGCCEDLTRKLDLAFTIGNLRRVSVSPFADVDACAAKLGGRYIFSWKPHPSHLCGRFAPQAIAQYIQHAIDVTEGCVIEMILKDTHTCDHHPERFTQWTDIAQALAAEA